MRACRAQPLHEWHDDDTALALSAALQRTPEADGPFRNTVIKNLLDKLESVDAICLILTQPEGCFDKLSDNALRQIELFNKNVACRTARHLGTHVTNTTNDKCVARIEQVLRATVETALMYLMGTSDDIRVAENVQHSKHVPSPPRIPTGPCVPSIGLHVCSHAIARNPNPQPVHVF